MKPAKSRSHSRFPRLGSCFLIRPIRVQLTIPFLHEYERVITSSLALMDRRFPPHNPFPFSLLPPAKTALQNETFRYENRILSKLDGSAPTACTDTNGTVVPF